MEVQVEVVRTYQLWAAHGNDADNKPGINPKTKKPYSTSGYYRYAILGTRPDANGKNVVWGLKRIISETTRRQPKYNEILFEARFSLAECLYRYALSRPESEKTK